ncbi:NTF2-like protein [Pseudovirgaria hyperparasitica]|uniref:NTF2-like protein n=1 Tax=Pseudovirgaria hyperparasitica TaxID=470096 RepID=A0A6A6W3H6_9PEZI|nr:NTF2-like protein [Pseudovirgaria hyperparasitica]KAF2757412.1 NTF2-like protein [Pseudovirgaria hyperparasitica]
MSNGTSKGNGAAHPLPVPKLKEVSNGLSLLQPLSRKGSGPGVIVLTETLEDALPGDNVAIKHGVPSVPIKWAEEGYTVIEITEAAFASSKDPFVSAIDALEKEEKCEPNGSIGLVVYSTALWTRAAPLLATHKTIAGAIIYSSNSDFESLAKSPIPILVHLSGKSPTKLPRSAALTAYDYPTMTSPLFATPFSVDFNYASESVSHTRNLSFLKPLMHGPYFDLEAIWDEHTAYEFETRDVDATMSTMVQEPYVNHIPTMTGGIGRERLSTFYAHHFIFSNPDDTELELISRTVGIDRVIDEFIFKFTHDRMVDWLLPGVPPTGRYVEIPFTGVVNVRGDRLYHEHIAWDQGSVLRQLGLLPEYLPWPYEVEGGGKKEFRVPVAGRETAVKMRDKNGLESNTMFEFGMRDA